jgi:hypothetical protein
MEKGKMLVDQAFVLSAIRSFVYIPSILPLLFFGAKKRKTRPSRSQGFARQEGGTVFFASKKPTLTAQAQGVVHFASPKNDAK